MMSPQRRTFQGSILSLWLLLCLLVSPGVADPPHPAPHYPPYPEVWHRKLPGPKSEDQYLRFFLMPDGDYVIFYNKGETQNGNDSHMAFYFFSGRVLDNVQLEDFFGKYQIVEDKGELVLPNGITISRKNVDMREPKRCPQTLNYYFSITDRRRGTSENKSLLSILDHPRTQEVNPLCVDSGEEEYTEKVAALAGGLVPLQDGGVLLYSHVDGGIIVRFDAELQTRSTWMNTKLFWVDPSTIKWHEEGSYISYQELHDELVDRLQKEMK